MPLAVDIVLLPDEHIIAEAVRMNATFTDRRIRLAPKPERGFGIPHVTLAMGVVEESDLEELSRRVQRIWLAKAPLALRARSIEGASPAILNVDGPTLADLHEAVMAATADLLSSSATVEMLSCASDEEPSRSIIKWINAYRDEHAFENFDPHVTLGYGEVTDPPELPIDFEPTSLVVAHLGSHGTCRRLL